MSGSKEQAHSEWVADFALNMDTPSVKSTKKYSSAFGKPTLKSCGNNMAEYRRTVREWYANRDYS